MNSLRYKVYVPAALNKNWIWSEKLVGQYYYLLLVEPKCHFIRSRIPICISAGEEHVIVESFYMYFWPCTQPNIDYMYILMKYCLFRLCVFIKNQNGVVGHIILWQLCLICYFKSWYSWKIYNYYFKSWYSWKIYNYYFKFTFFGLRR